MYSAYKHTFPNGKVYIGITGQNPKKRWASGNGYKECPAIWGAIKVYGWENVSHEILFCDMTKQEAEKKEIELIAQYKSNQKPYGYNIENGGNCVGTHSEETKRKISAGNKGKVVSLETRQKLHKVLKGKGTGENNAFYNKKHSEKTKQEHSQFMKGNRYFKGHHHSDEFKRFKSEQMKRLYSNGGNPHCKTVERVNVQSGETKRYYSLTEASRQEQMSLSRMFNIVKQQKEVNGYIWRYVENE